MKIRALPLAALLCSLSGLALAGEAKTKTLTEFDGQDTLRWMTVVDGVMGGLSTAEFALSEAKTLVFSGETSLRNNGGFSSMRTRPQALEVGDYEGLSLRVRGDGRTYKLALRTPGSSRWIAYWAEFQTSAGEWREVRIPWSAWKPTSFGRVLPGPELDVATIDSVGFMLYDKQAGPFRLEVDWIKAYAGAEVSAAPAAQATLLETASASPNFKTLVTAVKAAGLVGALDTQEPLTVFAPSDAAFAKLPQAVLQGLLKKEQLAQLREVLGFHVVAGKVELGALLSGAPLTTLSGQRLRPSLEGGALKLGSAQVQEVVECSNGRIYVLDAVLLPELKTIPELAAAAGSFKTLLAAAQAAGLVEALTGEGPLTVFAPSDAAFARLPEGTVANLLRPERRADLVRILTHHVVAGELSAATLAGKGEVETLAGTKLRVSFTGGAVQIAGVRLSACDLAARNGVVHVVESVLLPPALEAPQAAASPAALEGRRLIERAIEVGVPLYNAGNPGACRAVYELAGYGLLGLEGIELPSALREQLKGALALGGEGAEADSRAAWALRRALDAAYTALAPDASK